MLWRATQGVVDGRMTLGDLVMVNAFMIQLYIPLGFLGVLYREIKQSLTDLEKMFTLMEREREIADVPGAPALALTPGSASVRFQACQLCLRPGAADPARHQLRDPGGQDRGGGRPVGLGQVDAGTAAVPVLRRAERPDPDRRAGHQAGHAGQRAPGHRHRAAGHRAVQRHGGIQHRLRPARRHARAGDRGRASRRTSTTSLPPRPRATTPWWASAA